MSEGIDIESPASSNSYGSTGVTVCYAVTALQLLNEYNPKDCDKS
jgi:hypothetical protein